MYEVRRYVAIVPYRQADITWLSAAANTVFKVAVFAFWLGTAAMFASIRRNMQRISIVIPNQRTAECSRTTLFFRCLARIFANSMNENRCQSHGETFVLFVISSFATFSSIMFIGALFGQHFFIDTNLQIDTIAEMLESNLPIVECLVDRPRQYYRLYEA